jgi:outer membrane lipoprotein carrier protein
LRPSQIFPLLAEAGAVDQLHQFLSWNAHAESRIFADGHRQGTAASRSSLPVVVAISRPGKLRWDIQKPYPQLVVGDGEKIWIYDTELKQVTVRKAGQAISGSPAALLSGNNDLEKNFTLS